MTACRGTPSPRLAHANALTESLNLDVTAHWTSSVEGFYGKLSKAGLLTVAKEAKATLPLVIGNVRKVEAARHVMKVMSGLGWLPRRCAARGPSRSRRKCR